jgi:hypothetical protein
MSVREQFDVPPMIRQGEIVQKLSGLLRDAVPGNWRRIACTENCLSMYSQGGILEITNSDGSTRQAFPPEDFDDLIDELREVMYRPGAGTWFSVTWTLTKSDTGEVAADVSFNYDEEPDWDDPINPGLYGLDLEDFPRDEEHIPDWLRRRLAEAERNAT